jgi:hypothetical protein
VTLALVLSGAVMALLCVAAAIGWNLFAASPREPVDAKPPSPIEAPTSPEHLPAESPRHAEPMPPQAIETIVHQEASPQRPELPPAPDDKTFRLLAGTWEDDYQGKRTMTLLPDGTGTMIVELSGMSGAVFGPRLTFKMEWSLDDGRLIKRTVGGEPEGKVKAILSMMGDRAEEEIIELTEERLLVEDLRIQKQFDWRRVTVDAQE